MPVPRLTPHERRSLLAHRVFSRAPAERPEWITDDLLRPSQVAALFQVSRRTVGDWARAGRLDPVLTPGGHRRFRATEVRALLASRRVEPDWRAAGSGTMPHVATPRRGSDDTRPSGDG